MNSPQLSTQTKAELGQEDRPVIKAFNPWERYFDEKTSNPLYPFGPETRKISDKSDSEAA